MNGAYSAQSLILLGKRFGLIACQSTERSVQSALSETPASFLHLDDTIYPGDSELDRFDALVLGVGARIVESEWFRPETLRKNTRPLLLAGRWDDLVAHISLQEQADDVIFAPFNSRELTLRLCRLATGTARSERKPIRSRQACVVIADDDSDIIAYLKTVLVNLDVDVHVVSDGVAALGAARRFLPDLLVLDVGLPLMSGMEVLRSLRNDPGTSMLKTVLLTASSDPEHVRRGVDLGALDYILKPFGHIDLIRKFKHLLGPQRSPRRGFADATQGTASLTAAVSL